jgi:hypothetical protein
MLGRQDGRYRPPRRGEVNQYVLVHVEDVDRRCAHAKQFGAEILEPTGRQAIWREAVHSARPRRSAVDDSQDVADVAPKEWSATSASEG